MDILNPITGTRIRLSQTTAYSRSENATSAKYKPLLNMEALELYLIYSNSNLIALLNALDNGQPGACIKFNRGYQIDGKVKKALSGPATLVRALQLTPSLPRPRLAFQQDDSTLYVVKPQPEEPEEEDINISPEDIRKGWNILTT